MSFIEIFHVIYQIVFFKAFTHLFCATCFQRSILLFIHFRLCKGYLAEMHLVEQLLRVAAVPVASQSLCPTKLALLAGDHRLGLRAGIILYWHRLHRAYHNNHQPRNLHRLPHPNFHLSHLNLVPLLAASLEAHLIYRFVINVYSYYYTWQPFSFFAKNEKFGLFRFFAKNRGAKKRKINLYIKPCFLRYFPLKILIFGAF